MSAYETVIQFPRPRVSTSDNDLRAALARGEALREEIGELLRRQETLAQEFEHRLLNGLDVIAQLLSSQSQSAATPEAAAQLNVAARRITAIRCSQDRLNIRAP
jgi:two-component system, sensor histidine kinase PdtaS